jgi:hypothetical protein
LIREVAPSLLEVYGVGFDVAAKLLIAVGDNPHRTASDQRPLGRISAVSRRSRHRRARSNATDSTAAAIAKRTRRSTGS